MAFGVGSSQYEDRAVLTADLIVYMPHVASRRLHLRYSQIVGEASNLLFSSLTHRVNNLQGLCRWYQATILPGTSLLPRL